LASSIEQTSDNAFETEEEANDEPPRQETERERLERMEKELAMRAEKVKNEKITELEEREKFIFHKNTPTHPAKPKPVDNLLSEKNRLHSLITKAEESYGRGEIEEENFKRIVSDYQKQILDVDVKIKKLGDIL
ncbi:MAG: hypothetical protein KKD39_04085, partial [Candidatus Altiarchaeota archaeon]|nr:hypothetical protein [Candidatus Altiarchaeota archaeon]